MDRENLSSLIGKSLPTEASETSHMASMNPEPTLNTDNTGPADNTQLSQTFTSQNILSQEDAVAMGIQRQGTAIDIRAEGYAEEQKRYDNIQQQKKSEFANLLNGVIKEEEARLERLDNTLKADEETKAALLGNPNHGSVTYEKISYGERVKRDQHSTDPEVDQYDLLPSYDEFKDNEPSVDNEVDPKNQPLTDDQYGEFIRDLSVVSPVQPQETAVKVIRHASVDIVDSYRQTKMQTVGDQAFLNAITKFKKDKFGKVTVVLPNSGFMCDIVGTGVVDLTNLYMNVSRNTDTYDYQLEQMRVIIKNVVGTSPKINPADLAGMIHHRDFSMMAYGHICATLDKVETVANCTECGKPFRISSRPTDLLMNMDDLVTRTHEIENAPNIDAYSLMSDYHMVATSIGIKVYLGHPSYQELIRCIRGYQDYKSRMTPADAHRFESMLQLLNMIRRIQLPTGITSNNIFQTYQCIMLLSQEDLDTVNNEVIKMNEKVIEPKFGIHEVQCPHCGKLVKDIAYEGLLDMLFYHTTVSSYLSNPEN